MKTLNLPQAWQERRSLVLSRVENAGFGWWIVLVAGTGFLCDAYDVARPSLDEQLEADS